MSELTIIADGKHLEDLIYEVDVLHKPIIASGNNHASICWQKDGMLTYFDYKDGLPGFYWSETTGDSKESFTSLSRLIQYMKQYMSTTDPSEDGYTYLLTAPVWKVLEREDDATREAFNKLLADIEINLGGDDPLDDLLAGVPLGPSDMNETFEEWRKLGRSIFKCLSCNQYYENTDAISEAKNACVTCVDTLGWQETARRVEIAMRKGDK